MKQTMLKSWNIKIFYKIIVDIIEISKLPSIYLKLLNSSFIVVEIKQEKLKQIGKDLFFN
jgi:hypothetical protein